jgi:hypothetical protein
MKTIACFTFVLFVMMVSSGWAQTIINNVTEIPTDHLKLWLKSDVGVVLNGSTVSKWEDQSGNGNDALQSNVNRQPVLLENELNGKPVLSFDGVDDRLGFTGSSLISRMTMFFVYKLKLTTPPIFILTFGPANNIQQRFALNMRGRPDNNNDNDMIIGRADNTNLVIASIPGVVKYDEWRNITITRDQTVHNTNVWWNDQMATITPEGSNVASSFSLGDSTASWGGIGSTDNYIPFGTVRAHCEIAELIVYDTLLSNEDRVAIEEYLVIKYNLIVPVELVSFAATVQGNSINLAWATATEVNNLGFEIQRSNDNVDFFTIGFTKGNSTTTEAKTYSFNDRDLNPGKYLYRLKQIDFDGTFEYSSVIEVEIFSPDKFSLSQNYPNPFNPSTVISYQLPASGNVTLKVYDLLGREVATLVNEEKPAGSYEVSFDASQLSSGVYIYRLTAGNFSATNKMTLLK